MPTKVHWTDKFELLLMAGHPSYEIHLVASAVHGNKIVVELADYPTWPDWQFCEFSPRAYSPPWFRPDVSRWKVLQPDETTRILRYTVDRAIALMACLRDQPRTYLPFRMELKDLWLRICIQSAKAARFGGDRYSDIDRLILASTAIFNMSRMVQLSGDANSAPPRSMSADPSLPLVRELRSSSERIRHSLRACLMEVGVDPHHWTEQLLLGLLMHPRGFGWIQIPIILRGQSGRTELERGLDYAPGVTDPVYRAGTKIHRAYQKAHGVKTVVRKTGPRRGHKKQISADRKLFEHYVAERRSAGVSPSAICDDHEAQRLYRQARNDSAAVLREAAVRRALRKATSI